MPKVKKLKKLKKGYVRANTVSDFMTTGAQVKIGSKRYKELIDRRENWGTKRYTSATYRNQTKALKHTIPSLYSKKPTFKKAIRLVKRKHEFNENDSKMLFNILKDIQEEKTVGDKFLKFTLKDNSNKYLPLNDKSIRSLTNTLRDGYFAEEFTPTDYVRFLRYANHFNGTNVKMIGNF